jgi:hypothetical protein
VSRRAFLWCTSSCRDTQVHPVPFFFLGVVWNGAFDLSLTARAWTESELCGHTHMPFKQLGRAGGHFTGINTSENYREHRTSLMFERN